MDSSVANDLVNRAAWQSGIVLSDFEHQTISNIMSALAKPVDLETLNVDPLPCLSPKDEIPFWMEGNKFLLIGLMRLKMKLSSAGIDYRRRSQLTLVYTLIGRLIRLEKQNGRLLV